MISVVPALLQLSCGGHIHTTTVPFPSTIRLQSMRVGPFHFVKSGVFVLLLWITQSSQLSRLGQRDLTQLSAEQIFVLANSVDPTKNIDTQNPDSHLSKLLIPRPGASCIFDH